MTYTKTHPWISFELNLDHADMGIWTLAGEAKAKCEQIAALPLKPAIADHLARIYVTRGVQGTTAIEGNTLTEDQVRKRIEGKLTLPPSQEYLGKEVDNILAALNGIAQAIRNQPEIRLSPDLIKAFNKHVLHDLTLDEGVLPGEIPKSPVGVFHYRGAPREDCEYLLERLCDWLNSDHFLLPYYGRDSKIVSAIFKAVIAHLYIAWIHPFGDGNGRTARLIEFFILFSSGMPDIAAHLLSNHYNATRSDYYKQLDHASKSGGDSLPFLRYALGGLVDGLEEQLQTFKYHQWTIAWHNFVHESFQATKSTKTHKRRRDLVLALTLAPKPVPLHEIRDLTPKIAAEYKTLHIRTLMRDLNAVIQMDLVRQKPEGYEVKKEKILAFLPFASQ